MDRGEKDMKRKERGDGTRIGIDGKNSLGRGILKGGPCYKSPKKERVFHVFKHLVANIKSYNADKI